ncbi:MAG: recombinase family protein [Lachnospiraceae bacterium]|nr:recombinase family protein [Lachnospiraceae bacterium]
MAVRNSGTNKACKAKQDTYGMGDIVTAEAMIQACRKRGRIVWAYGRVSTDAQELERQNHVFEGLGIDDEHRFNEKKSGKDFDRPVFRELMEKVEPGDLIVCRSVDRFGRNLIENERLRNEITFGKNVGIAFTDSPLLNRTGDQSTMGYLMSSIMYIFQSFFAETERNSILQRTAEGRRIAMENGVKFGRPSYRIPEKFREIKDDIIDGRISINQAKKQLGINYRTLKKWLRTARKEELSDMLRIRAHGLLDAVQEMDGGSPSLRLAAQQLAAQMTEEAEKLSTEERKKPEFDESGKVKKPKRQKKETDLDLEIERMEKATAEFVRRADEMMEAMYGGSLSVAES